MGCCCSKNNTESNLQTNDRSSIPAEYSSVNKNKLTKTFSEQVEKLKTQEKVFQKFLETSEKSSKDFQSRLSTLDFYYSQKDLHSTELESADFHCPRCLISYNDEENQPFDLPCGHLLCESCVKIEENNGFFKCETGCDAWSAGSPVKNEEIFEKMKSIQSGCFCFKHQTTCDLVCLNCRELLCQDCSSDHLRHSLKPSEPGLIKDLLQKSRLNLLNYQKNLQENLKNLQKIQQNFSAFQEKLTALANERQDLVNENQENLSKSLSQVLEKHLQAMQVCLSEILKIMPAKVIQLYRDSLLAEIEKGKNVAEEAKNIEKQPGLINQVRIGNFQGVNRPDFTPWEKTLAQISGITETDFFLLALTSLTVIS